MFALLHPAALLALTGLLVPVAIHLWNRRPGREVAVGSLRWLAAGANRRLRNLRLEQLGLLLLRAALLAVLAVAVAGPVWRQPQPASRGVVLLSPAVRQLPALAALRPGIDSLRRRGYALRWMKQGFPVVSAGQWRAAGATAGAGTDSLAGDEFAWARVQQAANTFPGQPLYVVTTAAVRDLQGSHRPLPAGVAWQPVPDTATVSWLQAATIRGKRSDSLRLLLGRSNATQTSFRTETARYRNEPGEQIRVPGLAPLQLDTVASGGRTFALVPAKPGPGPATPINCGTPLVIEIYASPAYTTDARYLEAALRAAATGLLTPPVLRRVGTHPANLLADWTFWLSEEPLPARRSRHGRGHVWREAAGPGVADTARLATTETQAAPVAVFRRGTGAQATASQPVWVDGRGRAVLSCQRGAAGTLYQLHTRLNPSWSTLADDPQLPARLLGLLQPVPSDEGVYTISEPDRQLARHDQRTLDPAQLTSPAPAQPAAAPGRLLNQRVTDLRPWLVLAAGLLFLLERLLAHRRATRALPPVAS